MSNYSKKKLLPAHPSQIPAITEAIRKEFESCDFTVNVDSMISGGADISITKGGMFKAVLGMRSALKVVLTPQSDGVFFEASVGIYGQQVIPTVISMFFFWPVLITQIWGLVKQAELDDRALQAAEKAIENAPKVEILTNDFRFCTNCGTKVDKRAKFCPECGNKI